MTSPIRIVREVASAAGLTVPDILGERRFQHFAEARHEVYYRMRTELGLTYPRIAQLVGGRNHTTIIHGAARHYAVINGYDVHSMSKDQIRSMARFVQRKRVVPITPFSQKMPELPRCRLDANAHRVGFVLKWIADGGTAHEALEPYGFNEIETQAFMRRFLPELVGLAAMPRKRKAIEMMRDEVAA